MSTKKRFQQLAGIQTSNKNKLNSLIRESLLKHLGEEEEKEEKEEEEVEDVDVEEQEFEGEEGENEEVDLGLGSDIEGDPKELIQSSLTQAYEAASAMGDEKLMQQIGNTITFFTRNHIVGTPDVE